MTLTAGFRCLDGFVLASDTEMTLGSVSFQGQKIQNYNVGSPDTLAMAASGNVAFAMTACQAIHDAVTSLPARDLDSIRHAINGAIERIYEEKIFKLWAATGRNEDDDFSLLIGVMDHEKQFAVLATGVNTVYEVPHYAFSGMGNQLAHYIAERLSGSGPTSTAVTEHLVSQIFREVKGKGVYVGGNTEILSRREDGPGRFFSLKMSRDHYRFLWGLDEILLSAVRVALDHKGHRPLPGHKLPRRLEQRLALMRKLLARLYAESSAESENGALEHRIIEFDTEYGDPFKDF